MRPIHAGLVGNDSIILLDEAHCARPFDQTVQAIEKYRAWNESLAPFQFVSLTATPTGDLKPEQIERDTAEDQNHPVLGKRIAASKPTSLIIADKATGMKGTAELVKELELQAKELAKDFACVGIIVNRVKTARELKAKLGEDAVLLTGRMRPLDRDRLLKEKLQPLLSNASGHPPKFVIGTQCLECGADFDFHALISECASLDALRQRFGRLNRVANRPTAKAVIVIRGDQNEDSATDPVYGSSLSNTWKWLNEKAIAGLFDFGISAVRKSLEDVDADLLTTFNAPSPDAPVLFPAHLDCWVQTNPIPTPDPDPALFLHGAKRQGQPDVQVVFRTDMGDDPKMWTEVITLCPPSTSEAVAVPISVFKKWIAGEPFEDDTADIEGGTPEKVVKIKQAIPRTALRWRGPENTSLILSPWDVSPHDTYIVPCTAEDAFKLGDFPFGLTDHAEEAFQRSRDKALIRIPGLAIDSEDEEFDDLISEALRAKLTEESPEWLTRAIDALTKKGRKKEQREIDPHPCGGWVIKGTRRLMQFDPTYLEDSEPGESFRGREVTLDEHSQGVADFAKRFASGCGLDIDLFYQVGLWHDLGKLDPRFQAMLKQSSPRTAVGKPLAKSARSPRTHEERKLAREVHRYPVGGRHELLSASLLATKTSDDLLLHLITTHHGSGRPFADPVKENDAAKKPFKCALHQTSFELEHCAQDIAGWNTELPERFWRIIRKHGWWGTAYLETVFRLADHAQSAKEQITSQQFIEFNAPPFTTPLSKEPCLFSFCLSGLDGTNPLAYLAALGILRLTAELIPGTKLHWDIKSGVQPILYLPIELTEMQLVERLYNRVTKSINPDAKEVANKLHKAYRAKKKTTDNVKKSIKEQKLRGKKRDEAIAKELAPLEIEELTARSEWLKGLESCVPAPFLSLGKSIAVPPEEFAAFANTTANRLFEIGSSGRSNADFVPAFGSEVCVAKNGSITPTEFQLITGSGHQFFLETFGKLMQSVGTEQLHRAIFGPWTYGDQRLSFRWDPIDDRRYAVSWEDPSNTISKTEHGANLLAAFALPYFPVCPTPDGAESTGFRYSNGESFFTWPIWSGGLGPDSVRSLIQLNCMGRTNTTQPIAAQYRIKKIFHSKKIEVGTPPLSKLNFSPSTPI